ncbi:DUF2256 domain-containing protein [Mucilaginibacter sp. ZT4R22]|uniref:DUF2256 domain-containing protein n=2 Tax=Mucilaginibacter pankratovii TaxID=2772110 RepID=A0ABR7WXB0_9SPHI|nr:DUF2256 domain-containing protein [Mucilaginibacter pankratovii]
MCRDFVPLSSLNGTKVHKGNKQNLPLKICQSCKKPFSWRKKWAKCWDDVKYCSDRCRTNK